MQRTLRRKGEGLGRPSPRFVLVFEHLLGRISPADEPAYGKLMRRRDYDRAVALWVLDDLVVRILWDRVVRYSQVYCVVTYLSSDELLARSLAAKLGREEIPIRVCWAQDPAVFARHLVTLPDVIRVYDPDPARILLYSPSLGRLVTDPRQIGII